MTTSLITLEQFYVVDTNALLWYLTGDSKLSIRAREIFEAAKRHETGLVIPAIAIAELYYADKKHSLFKDFAAVYRDLKSESYIEFVDFKADDVLDFDRDSAVPEMHDRIITGLARRLGAPLITSDRVISASGVVKILW